MQNPVMTTLVSLLTIAVIANIVLLNYTVFRLIPQKLVAGPAIETDFQTNAPVVSPAAKVDSCGPACQKTIQMAMATVDAKIATLSGSKVIATTTAQVVATPAPGAKEFFIPMGSGSTTKSDWEDVAGTDVYVDTANFPAIKQTYFEVSMRIPTKNGTVYARLYNVTDKHPVWNSDVSTDQDTSTFTTSKITLDSGNKQYRVQMKTTLQYHSILDNARIKILTK